MTVFLALSWNLNPTYIFMSDLFSGLTALVTGLFLIYVTHGLRLKEHETTLKYQHNSLVDETTALPNRRMFNRFTTEQYKSCSQQNLPFGIIIIDIDDFKRYNDTYGHVVGDSCLVEVSTALKAYAIHHDIFVARYGGEEFAAVVWGNSASNISTHSKGFLESIRNCKIPTKSGCGYLSASLGSHYTISPCGGTYESILHMADMAMYRSKSLGKNTCTEYQCM